MEVLGVCMVASRYEFHNYAGDYELQNAIANQSPWHEQAIESQGSIVLRYETARFTWSGSCGTDSLQNLDQKDRVHERLFVRRG